MAVDVRTVVLVRRPRSEVAAFMFDPAKDLRWTGGITSSRPDQPGRLREGANRGARREVPRRTFDYGYVVTRDDPDRLIEMRVERPFPMWVTYELEDADGGTSVAISAVGSPGRFFGWTPR